MKLVHLKVSGFRNIKDVSLDFDDSKIKCLVGDSGIGKSNLIDAIIFGTSFIKEKNKEALMSLKKNMPMLKENFNEDYFFQVEFLAMMNDKEYLVKYNYSFKWLSASSMILTENLFYKLNEVNSRYSPYIERTLDEAYYRPNESGRCNKKVKINSDELVINKFLLNDDLYFSDIVTIINNLKVISDVNLNLDTVYKLDEYSDNSFDSLDNLGKILYYLKKDYFNEYELMLDGLKNLYPNISDLEIIDVTLDKAYNSKVYYLYVNDNRFVDLLSFDNLNKSVKRVIKLLVIVTIAKIKDLPLLVMEDLDKSLTFNNYQAMLEVFSILLEDTKVLITTTSPYLINHLNLNNLYVGLTSEGGVIIVKSILGRKYRKFLNDSTKYSNSQGAYLLQILSGSNPNEELSEYTE